MSSRVGLGRASPIGGQVIPGGNAVSNCVSETQDKSLPALVRPCPLETARRQGRLTLSEAYDAPSMPMRNNRDPNQDHCFRNRSCKDRPAMVRGYRCLLLRGLVGRVISTSPTAIAGARYFVAR